MAPSPATIELAADTMSAFMDATVGGQTWAPGFAAVMAATLVTQPAVDSGMPTQPASTAPTRAASRAACESVVSV